MRLALRTRRPETVAAFGTVLFTFGLLTHAAPLAAQPAQPASPGPAPSEAGTVNESGPAIVPPKLVHSEPAAYPVAARTRGLEAEVGLKLTIDRAGEVTHAEVVEAQGHGFDEAAQQAALKFRFEPATRDGEAIPVQILFRYPFRLAAQSPDAAPPSALPANTGELSGTLRMSGTDDPLVGTELILTLPDGSARRLLTDGQGRFVLQAAPAGRYGIRVVTPGFRELTAQEEVGAGEATEVVYRITPEATGLEIVIQGERPAREVTRRTIERREIERVPGTGGDALRSIQSLPGVARPPGLAGFLIVRGSAPNDTQVFADGTYLPLIYHFGGLSSVVPTELLERIDFYPGNFSARYGRVMGGIIDVGLRAPDTQCFEGYGVQSERSGCYHGLLQVDLIDARALVQGPIGTSKEWSFALAGRRSWIDSWIKPVLEESGASVTSAPVYYDYQAIAERKVGSSRFSLRALGSDDRLELIVTDPFAQDPGFGGNLRFGTAFYRLQALYEDELSSNVSLSSMFSVGKDTVDFSVGNLLFDFVQYPIYMRNEFGVRVTGGVTAHFGLDFLVAPYDVTVRVPIDPPQAGEPDPGPLAALPIRETSVASTFFRPAWYGELELQPSSRLRVVPGVRMDYARDSGHADISPRVNARYDLIGSATPEERAQNIQRRRTTLKGGVGLYHQPPDPQQTDAEFGTPNIQSNRAVHYALGVEQELTQQVEISVEGFYKDLGRLVSRELQPGDRARYNNAGQGAVTGMEALLKYRPDRHFFGWIAYTLSRSVRQNAADQDEYLFEFDQTHNLIALGSYRLGRGWEFGAKFRLTSGPLVTPVVQPPDLTALYAADAASYVPIQGAPLSRRLPLFHQLDIRVDKRWQFRDWRMSVYLDVQNVYSNAAIEGLTYNYDFSQQQFQTGIPIIPSLGLRGEF